MSIVYIFNTLYIPFYLWFKVNARIKKLIYGFNFKRKELYFTNISFIKGQFMCEIVENLLKWKRKFFLKNLINAFFFK